MKLVILNISKNLLLTNILLFIPFEVNQSNGNCKNSKKIKIQDQPCVKTYSNTLTSVRRVSVFRRKKMMFSRTRNT